MNKIKAYAVVNRDNGAIKVDEMGTSENPYLSIHPATKHGKNYAEDNCNGYETVVECEIKTKAPKKHQCNCKHCVI